MLHGSVSEGDYIVLNVNMCLSKCLANFQHDYENNTCLLQGTIVVIEFPYYMMQWNK